MRKYISFNTQKTNKAKNNFENDFYKLLNNAFYGKPMENVRNRFRLELNKKYDFKKIKKQQSKLTFNGLHKSYENCDSCSFKQNEVKMVKPIYLGFALLELSKLHMYATYYDKLQPYSRPESIQLHYMDTNSFVVSMNKKIISKVQKIQKICLILVT